VKLVASMIVHNERHRYLPLAIPHLVTFCDEIRVLDDGSTDGTYEWLGGLRDAVIVHRNPGPAFFEHEGAARQALHEWTLRGEPDYVLAIDADEFVANAWSVREAVEAGTAPIYSLTLREVWKAEPRRMRIRVDGKWGDRTVPVLYRTPPEARHWRIANRALACGREPLEVARKWAQAVALDAQILHLGWANEKERRARYDRYVRHDRGRYHANSHLRSIMFPDSRVTMLDEPWPFDPALAKALVSRASE